VDSGDFGFWERVNATVECEATYDYKGDSRETWADRNDESCRTFWPKGRAGHTAVLDTKRNGMWLHGGFTSYFPYPSTSGTSTRTSPFDTYKNYLDDLWFYNFTDRYTYTPLLLSHLSNTHFTLSLSLFLLHTHT
jgi:hypothetical protein